MMRDDEPEEDAEDEGDEEQYSDEDEEPPPLSEHEVADGADGRYKFRFELHKTYEYPAGSVHSSTFSSLQPEPSL